MITPMLDEYLLDYGIAQFVSPSTKATVRYLEITVFAAIEALN